MTREQRQVEMLRIKVSLGANNQKLTQTREPLTIMGLEIANRLLREDLEKIEKQQ